MHPDANGFGSASTGPPQSRIEDAILALLEQRGPGKTICPSEVARALAGNGSRDGWRALMPAVRSAADRLARAGRLQVTQRGQAVPATIGAAGAVGPIRLARPAPQSGNNAL